MAFEDTATLEKVELKKPTPYNVVLSATRPVAQARLNQNVVMAILKTIFGQNDDTAISICGELFTTGKAIANTYTEEVANEKVIDAEKLILQAGQDLRPSAEPAAP